MVKLFVKSRALVAVALVVLGGAANDAHAQAWVGDKGALDLGLDYNLGVSSKVIASSDLEFEDGGTTSHELVVGAEYVPVRHLAVTVALPLLMLKYTGDKVMYPHAGGGAYDDGELHATLTDLRAGVRYQILDHERVALSPHLAASIPVADYETIGNSVAGRHLKALHAGLSVGYLIGDATYAHLFYEFSLVEKYDRTADTAKYSQNRSDAAFTIGHKLFQYRFDVHLDANIRRTHGGVGFEEFPLLTPDEALYHDGILDEDVFLVGGGLAYQISNSLSVGVSGRLFVQGSNTPNASVLGIGLGWSPLL